MIRPYIVKTNERIFEIEDYEGQIFLCNIEHLCTDDLQYIKRVRHYWDRDFKTFGKIELKDMLKTIEAEAYINGKLIKP